VLDTFLNMKKKKKKRKRGKQTPKLGKRHRSAGKHPKATEWHKAVCVIAEKYANQQHDAAILEAATSFNTTEDAVVKLHRVGGAYWARKRNNPTVPFPIAMANTLRKWYNEQNPHCSPDEAAERLRRMPEYKDSLYVKHAMHAGKIKAFFSGLKSKKVNGVVPVLSSIATATGYKQWSTLSDLKEESKRRIDEGTMAKPLRQPTAKAGWAQLLELNDVQVENAMSVETEEAAHGEESYDDAGDVSDDDDDADESGPMCIEEAECVYDQLGNGSL
jgi:hypothetical protein